MSVTIKNIVRIVSGSAIVLLFVLSTPMIYALLTYYYLPETYEKPTISNWYYGSDNPREICVDVGYHVGGMFMPDALSIRLVIDEFGMIR